MTVRERLEQIRQQEYLTVSECALLLTCSPKTIRKYHRQIPMTARIGRVIRIHRVSAVRYFLDHPRQRTRD